MGQGMQGLVKVVISGTFIAIGAPHATVQAAPGLAATPPMGWNSWNRFGCDINEDLIHSVADALVSTGMRDAGYRYLNLDDCWQNGRDGQGEILADPQRFPSGIAALADYVHARGLQLGVYTDVGTSTCQGRPGSLGHEAQDARTYASWGVDYVKADWCFTKDLIAPDHYALMGEALRAAKRPMVFSICNWGEQNTPVWAPHTGNLWRTTGDISDDWSSVMSILDTNARLAAVAGPGHWNDPDMLEVGNGGMSAEEYRAHFSLWAMMAAPLIAGNDIRTMTPEVRAMLTNPEVIAINQASGLQGVRVRQEGGLEVWAKPLAAGKRAVLLFNRTEAAATLGVSWSELGLQAGAASVRDLWARSDLGTFTELLTPVASHGAMLFTVTGNDIVAAPGVQKLSDLPWIYAANYWGPVGVNRANGDQDNATRNVLSLDGKTYLSGLGVHAPSLLRYRLGGRCQTLHAVVGLDDEVGPRGAVAFEVWGDGVRLYASGSFDPLHRAAPLAVDVRGYDTLDLIVRPTADSFDFDHADWADATLSCSGS